MSSDPRPQSRSQASATNGPEWTRRYSTSALLGTGCGPPSHGVHGIAMSTVSDPDSPPHLVSQPSKHGGRRFEDKERVGVDGVDGVVLLQPMRVLVPVVEPRRASVPCQKQVFANAEGLPRLDVKKGEAGRFVVNDAHARLRTTAAPRGLQLLGAGVVTP